MTKQRLLQHLQRTAGSCRAVAFDVFDTLLYRDVAAPADLFALSRIVAMSFCEPRS